jgi:hypothetical protein
VRCTPCATQPPPPPQVLCMFTSVHAAPRHCAARHSSELNGRVIGIGNTHPRNRSCATSCSSRTTVAMASPLGKLGQNINVAGIRLFLSVTLVRAVPL